jgi:hypothetical protein
MLVSTIITNGMSLADVPNTSFFSASESLFAVQLAWEQVYAFLATNNDDYFATQIYIDRTTVTTGDIATGSPIITNVADTTKVFSGLPISDGGVNIPDGTLVLTVGATSVTMDTNATGTLATSTITVQNMVEDPDRPFVSGILIRGDAADSMFPDGFYRLRMIQYQGMGGSNQYQTVSKMTIENYGNTQNTPAYRMIGPIIAVYDPAGYERYCLWYYPRPDTLITTTDLDYPYNMIPEIMAYQVAAEIRRKQKADIAPWTSRVNELYASMALQMSRDDSHGEPIKNQFAQGFAPYI